MESSIAVFLPRQLACEQLPTSKMWGEAEEAMGRGMWAHVACALGRDYFFQAASTPPPPLPTKSKTLRIDIVPGYEPGPSNFPSRAMSGLTPLPSFYPDRMSCSVALPSAEPVKTNPRKLARHPGKIYCLEYPATRNRTRDHLIAAVLYSQMLYQLSYSRLARREVARARLRPLGAWRTCLGRSMQSASCGIRAHDLPLTERVLCQLS